MVVVSVWERSRPKTDPGIALALMYSRFGDRTVTHSPLVDENRLGWAESVHDANGKSLAELLRERQDDLAADTLRFVCDGRRVAKHYAAPPTAIPLDWIGQVTCPKHGTVAFPDQPAAIAEMRAFLYVRGLFPPGLSKLKKETRDI
ncbi:MAG TPA: hypothetical protein VLZ05_05345 [Mycobacterium sp.]|nr:hypothetical protein [Mycobacterium sp.]HUH68338.1 hypothetical protein [Mycobacterium sp.]